MSDTYEYDINLSQYQPPVDLSVLLRWFVLQHKLYQTLNYMKNENNNSTILLSPSNLITKINILFFSLPYSNASPGQAVKNILSSIPLNITMPEIALDTSFTLQSEETNGRIRYRLLPSATNAPKLVNIFKNLYVDAVDVSAKVVFLSDTYSVTLINIPTDSRDIPRRKGEEPLQVQEIPHVIICNIIRSAFGRIFQREYESFYTLFPIATTARVKIKFQSDEVKVVKESCLNYLNSIKA